MKVRLIWDNHKSGFWWFDWVFSGDDPLMAKGNFVYEWVRRIQTEIVKIRT